jgi:hypothetical protein
MVKATQASPPGPSPSIKKPIPIHSQPGPKNQQSILGFFRKKDVTDASPSNGLAKQAASIRKHTRKPGSSQALTPAPSSDTGNAPSSQEGSVSGEGMGNGKNGLPSPVTPAHDGVHLMGGIRRGAPVGTIASSPPSKRVSDSSLSL